MAHRRSLAAALGGWSKAISLGARLLAMALLAAGCASLREPSPEATPLAFVASGTDTLLARHAPIILVEQPELAYNRIGTVRARYGRDGEERLYVDPDPPTLYTQSRSFSTRRGTYSNLIYRMHFEKVPFSLLPLHLTTGRNSGLLVVVTLDNTGAPVLVTTVHTCGCYLAFVPTDHLPADALPDGWDPVSQRVFGARLPGQLAFPTSLDDDARVRITLETGTHRVIDIGVATRSEVAHTRDSVRFALLPMAALERVPLDEGTTSFYREAGARRGYVKGSFKPLELILMSWWALDLHVGVDKEYGESAEMGTVFYTSLQPWRRRASDMWNFSAFLRFWGWRL